MLDPIPRKRVVDLLNKNSLSIYSYILTYLIAEFKVVSIDSEFVTHRWDLEIVFSLVVSSSYTQHQNLRQ